MTDDDATASLTAINTWNETPVFITAGPGEDYVCTFRSNEIIEGREGDDIIRGFSCKYGGDHISITSGEGNDIVYDYCLLEGNSVDEGNGTAYIRENARQQNDNRNLRQRVPLQKRKQFHGRKRRR